MKLTKKTLVSFAQIVLALALIFLMLAPCVTYTVEIFGSSSVTKFTGFEAWLGSADSLALVNEASFCGILTLVFAILLALLPCAKVVLNCLKNKKFNTLIDFVILGLSVVAAIFLFCGASRLMLNVDGDFWDAATAAGKYGLGIGAIIDAIIAIVLAVSAAVDAFLIKD